MRTVIEWTKTQDKMPEAQPFLKNKKTGEIVEYLNPNVLTIGNDGIIRYSSFDANTGIFSMYGRKELPKAWAYIHKLIVEE